MDYVEIVVKRIMIIGLTVIVAGCLSGCELIKTGPTEQTIINSQVRERWSAFLNKDGDALIAFFNYDSATRDNLENEIQEGFDFIDGTIVRYDEPSAYIVSRRSTKTTSQGCVYNFYTDKDTRYSLNINSYYLYKDRSDMVGIYNIVVRNKDTEEYFLIGNDNP